MADYTVGSAFLQIVPSFKDTITQISKQAAGWGGEASESFSDTFNKGVEKQTSGVNLGPSKADSSKQGDSQAGAFADAFRKRVQAGLKALPPAKLTADDSQASATIDKIRSRMAALGDARIGIDISDTRAMAELEALKAELAHVGGSSSSTSIKVDTASAMKALEGLGADITGVLGGLESVGNDAGSGGGAFAKLGSTAAEAAPSIAMISAEVVGLLPALTTIGAVGAAAVAGVGIAAVSAGVGIGAFALAAAPELKSVTAEASAMLKQFQETNRNATLGAVTAGVQLVGPALKLLTPIVQETSKDLEGLSKSALVALGDPSWQNFADLIGGEAGKSLQAFGTFLGGAAKEARALTTAFAPFAGDADAAVTALGKFLDKSSVNIGNSNGLQSFFTYVRANGPLVETTLLQLSKDFGDIAAILTKLGPVSLAAISGLAKLVALPLSGLATGAGLVNKLASAVGLIPNQARGAQTALTTAFLGMAQSAGTPQQQFKALGYDIDSLKDKIGILQGTLKTQQAEMTLQVQNAKKYGDSASQVAAIQDSWNKKIATTKTNLDNNKTSMAQLEKAQDQLRPSIQAEADAQAAVNTHMSAAPSLSQQLVKAEGNLSNAQQDLQKWVNGSATAMGRFLLSELNIQGNQAAATLAISQLTDSFKTNGKQLDITTVKGANNRQAIIAATNSVYSYIGAMEKQHQPVATIVKDSGSIVAQMDNVFKHAGFTKSQIEDLNKQYGLTPRQIETNIKTTGYEAMLNQVKTANAQVQAIQNKQVKVEFDYSTGGAVYSNGNAGGMYAKNNAQGGVIKAAQGTVMGSSTMAAPGWAPGLVTNTPTYLVGEDGSGHDEYVIPTNPRYRSQAMSLLGGLTSALGLGGAKKFASGGVMNSASINFQSSAMPSLSNAANNLQNAALQLMKPPIVHAAGTSAQVSGWISEALDILGLPLTLANGIGNIVMHESGGNPSAINLWDSNAAAGHPSQGLMQTIPSTFAAYVLPALRSLGIDNPIANLTAGIRYAIANYGVGFLQRGGNQSSSGYKGYFSGGILGQNPMPWLANGGIATGPTIAGIGERGPEAVVPLDKLGSVISSIPSLNGFNILGKGGVGGNRTGVHVENAHFHDEADIKALMNTANFSLAGL